MAHCECFFHFFDYQTPDQNTNQHNELSPLTFLSCPSTSSEVLYLLVSAFSLTRNTVILRVMSDSLLLTSVSSLDNVSINRYRKTIKNFECKVQKEQTRISHTFTNARMNPQQVKDSFKTQQNISVYFFTMWH